MLTELSDFFSAHADTIISTLIGLASSYIFYYVGVRQGRAANKEYKKDYEEGKKEIEKLRGILAEQEKRSMAHDAETSGLKQNLSGVMQMLGESNAEATDILIRFKTFINENKPNEAQALLTAKRPALAGTFELHYMEALMEEAKGNFKKSVALLDAITSTPAFESHPDMHSIYFSKGMMRFYELDDYPQGTSDMEKAAELNSDDKYFLQIAFCLLSLQNLSQALHILDKIQDKNNPEYLYVTGKYYLLNDEYEKALKKLETVEIADILHAEARMDKASALLGLGRLDEAIESNRQALKLAQHGSFTHRMSLKLMGMLHIKKEDWISAKSLYDTLYNIYPDDLDILNYYFTVLQVLGLNKMIIRIGELDEIIKYPSPCSRAVQVLAQTYYYEGHYEKSIQCHETLLSVQPKSGYSLLGLYVAYMANESDENRFIHALRVCEKYREIFPEKADMAYNNEAIVYLQMKQFEKAEEYIQIALTMDPECPEYQNNVLHIKKCHQIYQEEGDDAVDVFLNQGSNTISDNRGGDYLI